MGIFNEREDRKYRDLIKIIKTSNISQSDKDFLVKYVTEIKDGKRNNDFFDFEFLQGVILQLINQDNPCYFNDLLDIVNFLFPQGEKTENYSLLKREFVINYCGEDGIIHKKLFNKEFYSLFGSRTDYLQVMNIILEDPNLIENFHNIVEFGISLGKEIEDQDLIKREIISYLHLYGSILSSDEDYLQKRINEAKKKYGVYPGIDEKNIAAFSREIEKAYGLIKIFESMEKRVERFEERVNAKTKEGLTTINNAVLNGRKEIETTSDNSVIKMKEDLELAKKDLVDELNKYLEMLENTMKENSDKVFSQMLIDAREKLDQIRIAANSLSGSTTKELLRIQRETQNSLETLQNYVKNNPELKSSLQVAQDSEEVMKALLQFSEIREKIIEERALASESSEKIIIPDKQVLVPSGELIIPKEDFMVPNFKMTEGILDAFNRKINFKERIKKIEESIARLESEGYIIPPALREALPWYMMGKKIVYFYGPTQSGKSTVADLLAKVVGSEMLDGGKITEEHSITSYNDVNGRFDENALFYSLYYGKTVFYDEMDNGNPDNLVVLGTFASKLVNKIDHPERDVTVQFAKRRFVPINVNARIIAAGNTTGKGRTREYVARSRFDESSQERLVPIYVGYSNEVENKIFGKYTNWRDFFYFFREQCNSWAEVSSLDSAEGNVTTGDASTIVECINEESVDLSQLINGIFLQTKEDDYLAFLKKNISAKYNLDGVISQDKAFEYNNMPLCNLSTKQIAEMFVFELNRSLNKERGPIKRK